MSECAKSMMETCYSRMDDSESKKVLKDKIHIMNNNQLKVLED